jgi:hypothetical protein
VLVWALYYLFQFGAIENLTNRMERFKKVFLIVQILVSSFACFAENSKHPYILKSGITIREAYSIQNYDEIGELKLRVDDSFYGYCNPKGKEGSIADFKNLRQLIIYTDFSENEAHKKSKDKNIAALNKWLADLGDLHPSFQLTIPSNLNIAANDRLKNLSIYPYRNLNPALYNLSTIENLNLMRFYDASFEFQHFKNLKKLGIHLKTSNEFDFKSIKACLALEVLQLKLDSISELDLSFFPSSLKEIDLQMNLGKQLDLGAMLKFTALKVLKLKIANVNQLNLTGLSKNLDLNQIEIHSQRLKSFDFNALTYNENLNIVHIYADSLAEITFPNSIQRSIYEIKITSKILAELPPDFDHFSKILSIELNTPKLKFISPDFYNANSLQDLNICSSSLTKIPKEISNLNQLVALTLSMHELDGNYEAFRNLTKLYQLSLRQSKSADLYDYSNRYKRLWLKTRKLAKILPNASGVYVGKHIN